MEDYKKLLEEIILKYDLFDCKIDIRSTIRLAEDYKYGITGRFYIQLNKPIIEFYLPIIDKFYTKQKHNIDIKGGIKVFLEKVVRHEYRHYQQYLYAKKYGLDWNKIEEESYSKGHDSKIEKDAIDYENGIENDISKLFNI